MDTPRPGRISKIIEVSSNIAIIIVAVVAIVVFARSRLRNTPQAPPSISAGTKLNMKQVDWHRNSRNAVFVLSTSCHFCKESSPFYQKLVQQCRNSDTRTIALFPQTAEEGQAYLKTENVPMDEVWRADFKDLQVGGTPTLLQVDGNGTVQKVWLGKLNSGKEQEVMSKLCG
jgi:hypothetical protein